MLNDEAGIESLQAEAKARAKAHKLEESKSKEGDAKGDAAETNKDGGDGNGEVHLSILADHCGDVELVKKHLDGDVLAKLMVKKQADMKGGKSGYVDPDYELVILGACAMSIGCTLPAGFKEQLKDVYQSVGLMRDAKKQMDKALNGPDGFKDGEPYNFDSPGLDETMMSGGPANEDRIFPGSNMLNVQAPNQPLPAGLMRETSAGLRRDNVPNPELKRAGRDACDECGVMGGGKVTLLRCSGCKKRKYWSVECQRAAWPYHKGACKKMRKRIERAVQAFLNHEPGQSGVLTLDP